MASSTPEHKSYRLFLQKIADERDEKISVITQNFKEKLLNTRDLAINESERDMRSKIEDDYDEQIFLAHNHFAEQIANFKKNQPISHE